MAGRDSSAWLEEGFMKNWRKGNRRLNALNFVNFASRAFIVVVNVCGVHLNFVANDVVIESLIHMLYMSYDSTVFANWLPLR